MPIQVAADPTATVYATADDIDDAAELRIGGSAWTALSGDQKDQAAATASADIDSIEFGDGTPENPGFIGDRTDPDQNLAWPRTGTDYDDDAWPTILVNAAIELAISYAPAFAAGTDPLNPDFANGNVKRKQVGPIETEYFAARAMPATSLERFPASVQRLLAPLMRYIAAPLSRWGSATVTRSS